MMNFANQSGVFVLIRLLLNSGEFVGDTTRF